MVYIGGVDDVPDDGGVVVEGKGDVPDEPLLLGLPGVLQQVLLPALERKKLVEDFRRGKIKVLVNVDIFSEGFDCPDVEFVQLARPTLSLAKYLQQVGRGLRRSGEKESCILIDNVGLYRIFGLPVRNHDWTAMFSAMLPEVSYAT